MLELLIHICKLRHDYSRMQGFWILKIGSFPISRIGKLKRLQSALQVKQ